MREKFRSVIDFGTGRSSLLKTRSRRSQALHTGLNPSINAIGTNWIFSNHDAPKMPTKKSAKYGSLKLLGQAAVHYPDSPSPKTLETFRNEYPSRGYWIRFECPEFTSMCPVTGQPDFARITIEYVPDALCIESKSLKFYLASYRNTRSFNEEIVNRILDDLLTACRPRQAIVQGEFAARGGINVSVDACYPDDSTTATNRREIVRSNHEKQNAERRRSHL